MNIKTISAGGTIAIGALMMTIALASPSGAFVGNENNGNFNRAQFEQIRELHDSITRTTENIENGVVITMTSDNQEAVTMLQSKESKEPRRDNVARTQENIENGIKITITSDDPEIVKEIQAHTEDGRGPEFGHRGKRGGGHGGCHGKWQDQEEESSTEVQS
ncbi:hypothetical protein IPN35_00540 [Candidatus Peregrinibacteria bacterium]|nr:MAG: hypothetical protein IPN35_00540 [Candidatus Peregrinibacteria bacterium]